MSSSDWIDRFYRNACAAKALVLPADLTVEDLRSLRAVRSGQLSSRSGQILIQNAKNAQTGRDGTFVWAVRLFVGEQERHQRMLMAMLTANGRKPGTPAWYSSWSAPVLDKLPVEAILLLLACRARVAANFFSTLAKRAASPQVRALAEQLADEQAGQLQFAIFASERMTHKDVQLPRSLTEPLRRTVIVAIAARVWLRQRRRLREAGQTFGTFVSAMLDQPALS